ncbi:MULTISPECIES: outer membrane protein assembly factor BamE [unclassified Brevundimonas]|uniref:outer membrane protein assembly factor BamE n=1 Tax=unclassified Brevundimonas TaxID=2622653 RepID=UPI0025B896AD|nr:MULTISPECIES: outer membrane protein assembly factor BamE [unclassified Brevundimonas]
MLRTKSLLAVISLTVLTAACAPRIATQGFQVIDNKPDDIVVGTDTRETVLAKLGSPSTASTFEAENVWYYVTQVTERYTYSTPKVTQRNITEITFNEGNGVVANVRTVNLDDQVEIAMAKRETPTRGRSLTVLEQLLGNVGRGQLPRTDQDVPGQQRRD